MRIWQVSWLGPQKTPSHSWRTFKEQWHAGLFDFLRNGPYSSGYCSGFTPDSLLNTGRMPTFHQKRCKIIKKTDNIIPVLKKYLQIGIFPVILASPFWQIGKGSYFCMSIFGITLIRPLRKVMKREPGANPGQTRCCEFLYKLFEYTISHCPPLRTGRHSKTERVRRPAKDTT